MKKLTEYFKEHKKILLISVLLIVLIALAFALYGSKNKVANTSSINTDMSASEIKLTRILSEIDGVGKAEVMINENEKGVEGVIIVCEGAYNIMTRNDILNAVATALKVEKNNIAIYAMNK
ncbi:MAG: hypothetical protein K2I17_01590 [Clostridia bacterium]|nr:hypothetical protein [Clostridia bacterium]